MNILNNGGYHDGEPCTYTMCWSKDQNVKDKCLGWCTKITENMKTNYPLMEIYVNGRKKRWFHLSINYEEAVILAYGIYTPERGMVYTVTYAKGENDSGGELISGQKVSATMNMVFNVVRTDKS